MTVGQKLDPINETRGTAICARVKVKKWAHEDSNLGPTGYEPAALTAELWAHIQL
jgi:hypothetical protein